jgi:hypothetical protein
LRADPLGEQEIPMVFYLGAVVLVATVYVVKELAVRCQSRLRSAALFGSAVVIGVPAAWVLDPDWRNPNVARVSIWVGTPIGLLAVPVGSFLFDLAWGVGGSWWGRPPRIGVELLVAVPSWFFGWLVVQVFVLGWVWF